jgi:serine/threonine-protein kinase RsbW
MATLSLFADLSQLATIRDFVDAESHALGLSKREGYDVRLAVDEACSNVIRHAYSGQGGPIEITVNAVNGGIQVLIRDWGKAFDVAAVPTPNVQAPLYERPLGGLGLFLMRQVMDQVDFEFDEADGNTLKMVKMIQER